MSLLFSNLSPLKTSNKTYFDVFRNYFENAQEVNIASGYISTDSVIDLRSIIEANNGPSLDMCVGMHYFDGFTKTQLDALNSLDGFLRDSNLGVVRLVVTFPFHGKIANFKKDGQIFGSIIGSSNLSNILNNERQYEADYLIDNEIDQQELETFIRKLANDASQPLQEIENIRIIEPNNEYLSNQVGAQKLGIEQLNTIKSDRSSICFEIPLKGDESHKSGLNASFGEGRRNQQGYVIPRSWYEVELIVPKSITTQSDYPKADSIGSSGCFRVYTDDGWSFNCKVSGDYSKNFRSENDLKILGRWLKGRLENSGALKPGERVSDETLQRYGRTSLTFTKIKNRDEWYLDFGVNHA